ncbi:MAG: restriction endonuclease, partial [Desulfobacterales bacterium]|nr:restriction endonuclease [Desulfobacterales bacterium]
MVYVTGFSPLGGVLIPNLDTTFDLNQKPYESHSIIQVSKFLSDELIDFFIKYPEEIKVMNRRKFECFIAELFDGFGYSVELTKQTRDGGKDIIAIGNKDLLENKYLIECKRPNPGNPVDISVVRSLYGVKQYERATKAIGVTTTYFSPDAHDFQKDVKWELEL